MFKSCQTSFFRLFHVSSVITKFVQLRANNFLLSSKSDEIRIQIRFIPIKKNNDWEEFLCKIHV